MKTFSFHYKLLGLLSLHFILLAYTLIFHWNWMLIFVCFVISKIIGNIGNEIALHRLWTHKSFQTEKWKEIMLHFLSVPLLAGSSIVYAGVHRTHHAYSDTDKDPHDTSSLFKLFFYVRKNKQFFINPKIVNDLLKDPIHRWTHKNYFLINVLVLLISIIVLGPIYTGYFLSFTVFHCFVITGLVNYLGHLPDLGTRKYRTNDLSTNNRFLQFLTFYNHGLHNNHHKYPSSYTNAQNEDDIDPLGWIIKVFLMKRTT
jgi:fatty-acid desaturase